MKLKKFIKKNIVILILLLVVIILLCIFTIPNLFDKINASLYNKNTLSNVSMADYTELCKYYNKALKINLNDYKNTANLENALLNLDWTLTDDQQESIDKQVEDLKNGIDMLIKKENMTNNVISTTIKNTYNSTTTKKETTKNKEVTTIVDNTTNNISSNMTSKRTNIKSTTKIVSKINNTIDNNKKSFIKLVRSNLILLLSSILNIVLIIYIIIIRKDKKLIN